MSAKTKPKAKAPAKPAAKTAAKPVAKPAAKPAAKAASKPALKPAAGKKKPEPARKSAPPAKPEKLTKAKGDELRQILEDLREATLKEINEKGKSGSAGTSKEIGDIYDQASEERDRELDLLLSDRERGKLLQIDDAFARLQEGTYGMCEECGEPINPKRLRIVPFTRTCVDCQTDKEHEERRQRDRDVDERVYGVYAGEGPTSTDDEE